MLDRISKGNATETDTNSKINTNSSIYSDDIATKVDSLTKHYQEIGVLDGCQNLEDDGEEERSSTVNSG